VPIDAKTPIVTDTGWTLAELVKPGDYLFNEEGLPTLVKSVQIFESASSGEIIFDDGLGVTIDGNTKFPILTYNAKNIITRGFKPKKDVRSVSEILDVGLIVQKARQHYWFSVPTTRPIQFPEKSLPVPPFIVGVWFTRNIQSPNLSIHKDMVNEYIRRFRMYGYNAKRVKRNKDYISMEFRPNIQHAFLTKYPSKQFTIPDEYLISSESQRMDLLRGIFFDKKRGYSTKTDTFRFFCEDISTAKRIQGLVESLGIRTVMYEHPSGSKYRLFFKTDLKIVENQVSKKGWTKFTRRTIRDYKESGPKKFVFIDTGGFFVAGEGFIPLC
jgi:hypothetical protein